MSLSQGVLPGLQISRPQSMSYAAAAPRISGMRHAGPRVRWQTLHRRAYKVDIETQSGVETITVEEGNTILQTALDQGIELTHDCKMGVCMTCPAKLVSRTCLVSLLTVPVCHLQELLQILSHSMIVGTCTMASSHVPRGLQVQGCIAMQLFPPQNADVREVMHLMSLARATFACTQISGDVDQSAGMLDNEAKEKGYALMCVAEPQSDCRIRVIEEVSHSTGSWYPLQMLAVFPKHFSRMLSCRGAFLCDVPHCPPSELVFCTRPNRSAGLHIVWLGCMHDRPLCLATLLRVRGV